MDQIVLARAPARALAHAVAARAQEDVGRGRDGLRRALRDAGRTGPPPSRIAAGDVLAHGVLVARGRASASRAPVHLERFASPARLCVTDEPRLAGVGGIGMLSLVVPTASLGRALAQGSVVLRRPVSVQVLLGGAPAALRLRARRRPRAYAQRPGRRGAARGGGAERTGRGRVRRPERAARSRSESAACWPGWRPQLGAAAALFVSDERTEVFLRDQRRSKAHRALAPDAGAPCEEVVNLDLGAVDPLLLDDDGQVRAVRDLAGQPVTQVSSAATAASRCAICSRPRRCSRASAFPRGSTSCSPPRRGRCSRCSQAPAR